MNIMTSHMTYLKHDKFPFLNSKTLIHLKNTALPIRDKSEKCC